MLVVLKDHAGLSFLLRPDLSSEEQRVWYVAVNRVRGNLFLCVPALEAAAERTLSIAGFTKDITANLFILKIFGIIFKLKLHVRRNFSY